MTLKEQALEHWRENKELLKAMNWKEWVALPFVIRRDTLFIDNNKHVPHIGGDSCPYCQHYSRACIDTHSRRCPLYDPRTPGSCCKEWRFVREALLRSTTKSVASRAINRMIKRLEAL